MNLKGKSNSPLVINLNTSKLHLLIHWTEHTRFDLFQLKTMYLKIRTFAQFY